MPDFTLPVYQGGTLTLSSLRGKNVLILFPARLRGRELLVHDLQLPLRRAGRAREGPEDPREIQRRGPGRLPPTPGTSSRPGSRPCPASSRRSGTRRTRPTRPSSTKKERSGWSGSASSFPTITRSRRARVLAPFPILVDGERTISKNLDLFRTEWTGSKVDQNIPSVYIIDANGVLQFEYLGQNTVDRPGYDYLFKVLEVINAGK